MVSNDRAVLRDVQYVDSSNHSARMLLHQRFSTGATSWFDWVLDRLPAVESATVLEVGCGGGMLWRSRSARIAPGWRLVLADLSVGMVAEASAALPAASCIAADAVALPFDDACFDVVVANHMLYHLADPAAGVRELHRVLRPGGTLVAATNGARHMAELAELEAEALPHLAEKLAVRNLSFSLESGGAILSGCFSDVRLDRFDDGLVVTEVDPLVAYIASMEPTLIGTGERLALADVVARHLSTGPIIITKDSGLFIARRRPDEEPR